MTRQPTDVESIFAAALEIDAPARQAAFLDEACNGEQPLRAHVEALLRASREAGGFLERPAVGLAPTIVGGQHDTLDESDAEMSLAFLAPSDKPGCLGTLGQYETVEVVGRGGMGVVLRAYDTKLNRVVAIKVMAPELAVSPTAVKRFLREARAAAAIGHDHVVTIFAIDEANHPPFLVMEFVDGMSLQEKIERVGGLELMQILRIGMQTAAGLAAAHKQGLVHRDIKPANILLENGVERVKITDFGLARAVDDVGITQPGLIAGTPQFMSPEQAQGQPLDVRSDLFSLGSVLFAMCTGRSPFRAESAVATLRRVCDDTPRPIREVNAEIPDWLEAIIAKLLAKDPVERFQSAEEVADLLGRHLAHLQHPTTVPQPAPVSQRNSQVAGPGSAGPLREPKPLADRADYFDRPAPRRVWPLVAAGLAAMFVGISLLGVVFHVVTDRGTLVIESDDENAEVQIGRPRSDGHEGLQVRIVDRVTGSTVVRLRSGHYRLNLMPGPDGNANVELNQFQLSKNEFVLKRGGKVVVRVMRSTSKENIAELTQISRLEGHTKRPMELLFLADGKRALSSSGDGTIRLWNVRTGEVIRQFVDDRIDVANCMALSSDEALLVTGHGPRYAMVLIWDFESGRVLNRFLAHESSIFDIGFIPGTNQVVTVAYDNFVRFWDTTTGKKVGEVGPLDGANCLAIAPSGSVLVGRHDRLQLLEFPDFRIGRELHGHEGGAADVAISRDGKLAASATSQGPIYLWNLQTGQQLARLEGHTDNVDVVTFTPDGRFLVSGSWDRTLRVWDVARRQEVARATTANRVSLELAVSPDGRTVLAGGGQWWDNDNKKWVSESDYALRLWRLPDRRLLAPPDTVGGESQTMDEVRRLPGHTRQVEGLQFFTDGRAISASYDMTLRIWDVATGPLEDPHPSPLPRGAGATGRAASATGEQLKTINTGCTLSALALSPDQRLVAVGTHDGPIEIWNLETSENTATLEGHTDRVVYLAFTPDGRRLMSSGFEPLVRVWDLEQGKELRAIEISNPDSASLSPDGRFVVARDPDEDRKVRAWDADTGQIVKTFDTTETGKLLRTAFSTDGSRLATGSIIGVVQIWDLAGGNELCRIDAHQGPTLALAFTPDGRRLVSSGIDGALRLWDAATGRKLAEPRADTRRFNRVAMAPDGRHVITGGGFAWDSARGRAILDGDNDLHLYRLPETSSAVEARRKDAGDPRGVVATPSDVEGANSIGMTFRLIPAGEFDMGTADDQLRQIAAHEDWFFADFVAERRMAETPRHRVTITRPFYVGAYEVTVGQFRQFMNKTGYRTTAEQDGGGFGWRNAVWQEGAEFNWRNPGFPQSDDHPVSNVSWADAVAFCRWLSDKEGEAYRLPTEAEWEYACRARTTTMFSTGDDPDSLRDAANLADASLSRQEASVTWAVAWDDGYAATAPVGSFAPNAFGLYDMHGNACEWCEDEYDSDWYPQSPGADPVRRGSAESHVFRGGGWDNWPGFLRSADRYSSHSPTLRTEWAGFRVVRETAAATPEPGLPARE